MDPFKEILEMKGDPKFEVKFYEGIVKHAPHYIDALKPLAEAYTRAGEYRKGLAVDKKLCVLCKDDPGVYYNLACSYALVGEKEKALEALEHAIGLGYSDAAHMKKDPDLQSLSGELEFQKLLKRLEGLSSR